MDVTSWTNNTIAALIQIRGEGKPSPQGHRLPLITALDTIAVLGRFAPMLANSIAGLQNHHNTDVTGAINKRSVNADGTLGGEGGLNAASDIAGRISIAKYLAGYGVQPLPYNRRTTNQANATQYTFFIGEFLNEGETALVTAHREAVREWQRAIDASTSTILSNATNLTGPARADDNIAFWSAIRGLAASLDAIRASPPEDVFDRIKGATSHALNETGRFVGESAAKIADQVGQVAGQAAEGFFSQAGATALIVAGLAVYMVIK